VGDRAAGAFDAAHAAPVFVEHLRREQSNRRYPRQDRSCAAGRRARPDGIRGRGPAGTAM